MNNAIYKRFILVLLISAALAACAKTDDNNRVVGQLESDRIEITAESNEPITARMVKEGQWATAGQELYQQNTQRIEARISEAQAITKRFEAQLAEIVRGPRKELIVAARAALTGAEQDVSFRQIEFERAKKVLAQQLGSPEQLDRAKAALDAAQANLKSSRAKLEELLNGATAEELAQAEQLVNESNARLAALEIDLARLTTRAPADSLVDSLLFEPGERPQPGQPVAILLAGQQPYARVYVPESLRVQLRPGMQATIYIDGLSEPVTGHIRWIASDPVFTPYFALTERDRGRLSYIAKIDVDSNPQRLPDGIPVEVDFSLDTPQ
jgi:HlyD family secretion protein